MFCHVLCFAKSKMSLLGRRIPTPQIPKCETVFRTELRKGSVYMLGGGNQIWFCCGLQFKFETASWHSKVRAKLQYFQIAKDEVYHTQGLPKISINVYNRKFHTSAKVGNIINPHKACHLQQLSTHAVKFEPPPDLACPGHCITSSVNPAELFY